MPSEAAFDISGPVRCRGTGFQASRRRPAGALERIAECLDRVDESDFGYSNAFVAQGGDWGAVITDLMGGGRAPPELLGIHTNTCPARFPA